jgi:hypothetical protein
VDVSREGVTALSRADDDWGGGTEEVEEEEDCVVSCMMVSVVVVVVEGIVIAEGMLGVVVSATVGPAAASDWATEGEGEGTEAGVSTAIQKEKKQKSLIHEIELNRSSKMGARRVE